MKATIRSIKDNIELPENILKVLKVKENDDVDVVVDGNELVINNVKIKELSAIERLTIHSIKNDFKKLDWGEV
jgi:antitoxin component of MazEF toxin-antitoxin module